MEAADATDAVDPNDVVIDYDEAFDGSSVPIAAASATTKGLEAIPLVAGETAEPTGSDNSPKRRHDSLDDSQATNEPAEAETDGSQSNLSNFRVLTVAPEQIADASFSLQTMPNVLASRRCRLRPKRRDITLPLASRFFRKLGSARYPPFVLLEIPSFSRFQPRYLARASNLLVPAFRSPGQAAGGFRSSPRPHSAAPPSPPFCSPSLIDFDLSRPYFAKATNDSGQPE